MPLLKNNITKIFWVLFYKAFKKRSINNKIRFTKQFNILILQLGTIQDALTITPLINILSENLNCSIDVLASKNNQDAFYNNSSIKEIIINKKGIKHSLRLIRFLLKNKYDVVIDPNEKVDEFTSVLTGITKAKYKIGFRNESQNLLTNLVPILGKNKNHIIDRLVSLANTFELQYSKANINISYTPSLKSKNIIEDYLITHDLNYKFRTVVNVSNDYNIGFWGIDNYIKLIKYIKNYNTDVIVTSAIEDIEVAEKIAGDKNLIYYNTDTDVYAELLRNANFIFSPESFTIQLASAFKVPIFCLFAQNYSKELINVPYNSDFDFALTEKSKLEEISYGKALNSFVQYFEYIFERYKPKDS